MRMHDVQTGLIFTMLAFGIYNAWVGDYLYSLTDVLVVWLTFIGWKRHDGWIRRRMKWLDAFNQLEAKMCDMRTEIQRNHWMDQMEALIAEIALDKEQHDRRRS